jgi:hypothetical protein
MTTTSPHGILSTTFNTTRMIAETSFTTREYEILDGLILIPTEATTVALITTAVVRHVLRRCY